MELTSVRVPFRPVSLYTVGDLQYGVQGCDFGAFKKYIEKGVEENAYFVYLGDMFDVMSPSNRERILAAALYDSVHDALEQYAETVYKKVMRVLEPTKGRWWGGVHGHHLFPFRDGTTSDTRMAKELQMPYLGTAGLIGVHFDRKSVNGKGPSIRHEILIHHGAGGTATVSGAILKMERYLNGFPTADVIIMGHTCQRFVVDAKPKLLPNYKNKTLKDEPRKMVNAGGWVLSAQVGTKIGNHPEGNYAEKLMLPAAPLGNVVIDYNPHRVGRRKDCVLTFEGRV